MNVLILSDCWADGKHLRSGEITTLPEPTAQELISIERAEPTTEPSAPDPLPAPRPGRESKLKPKPKE
jgi:hypothetical protein